MTKGLWKTSDNVIEYILPSKPKSHWHMYPLVPSWQVPLFWHGLLLHTSMLVSQFAPIYMILNVIQYTSLGIRKKSYLRILIRQTNCHTVKSLYFIIFWNNCLFHQFVLVLYFNIAFYAEATVKLSLFRRELKHNLGFYWSHRQKYM